MSNLDPKLEQEVAEAENAYNNEVLHQEFYRNGFDMIEIRRTPPRGNTTFLRWVVVINEGEVCQGFNTELDNCKRDSKIAYDAFLSVYR